MNVIILMIMCIAKMIYLALPTFILITSIQAIVYKITGISLYNKLVNLLSK